MRLLLLALLGSTLFAQQTQPAPATVPAVANPQSQAQPAAIPQPPVPNQATSASTPGNTGAPLMGPTDAYQYAMQPLNNARSAPDDLTDADRWALGIGVARAKEQCELRAKDKFVGEDLLAMGKLCIFGQDYEPARAFLLSYIALPQPKSPEVGRLLLARAFIGLDSITSAESQMDSLLTLFPYDASIHLGIDMVIDAACASDATSDLDVIPRLEEQQLPHILDALNQGGSLSGNGDSVDAARLAEDALRYADALRRSGKPDQAAKIVDQVSSAAATDAIVRSASNAPIQNALTRYALVLQPSPVRMFHATLLPPAGLLSARTVPLYDPNPVAHRVVRRVGNSTEIRMKDDRTLVLVFSLAGPASSTVMHGILDQLGRDHIIPGLKVIAVTSYAVNTGDETPNPNVLATLRAFRTGLPATLPVYLVPDGELRPFAIDAWPAGILFDGKGRIFWIKTIAGSAGGIHQAVREIESGPPPLPF
ncbi:MAG: hypothetical protein ACLGXA_17475 [Acidobacteriota bacterium]